MLRRGKNDPNLDSFRANLPGKMPKISWEGNVALNSSVPAVPQLPVQRVPIPVPNWAAQGGRGEAGAGEQHPQGRFRGGSSGFQAGQSCRCRCRLFSALAAAPSEEGKEVRDN